MNKRKSYIGERFGRLVVVEEPVWVSRKHRRVETRCDCGTVKTVWFDGLPRRTIKSCGCLSVEVGRRIGSRFAGVRAAHTVSHRQSQLNIRHGRRCLIAVVIHEIRPGPTTAGEVSRSASAGEIATRISSLTWAEGRGRDTQSTATPTMTGTISRGIAGGQQQESRQTIDARATNGAAIVPSLSVMAMSASISAYETH